MSTQEKSQAEAPHDRDLAVITIDAVEFKVRHGAHSVPSLKELARLPADAPLAEVIDRRPRLLPPEGVVDVKGGEVFISPAEVTIDGRRHHVHRGPISVAELKEIGEISAERKIALVIDGEKKILPDDGSFEIRGGEVFVGVGDVTIIVNARPKKWGEKLISFEQLVHLAFPEVPPNPNRVYTVTYKKGPHENPEGSMVAGQHVHVKSGMVFNVTATDKS